MSYTVRTIDSKKYMHRSNHTSLKYVYKDVMEKDSIVVTQWGKDKEVIINTKNIVSIEHW
ncbi:hypothetical protein [Staphylococcus phage Stab23]|nr:hypothetical protein [Staphylococcus phage Stab23]VEV88736.1 hypothetical protein [Staphylococcus phage Stab23]